MADDRPNAEEQFFEKHPSGKTRELYENIKEKIFKLDEGRIQCESQLRYVAFKPNHETDRNFVHLHLEDDTFEFYLILKDDEVGSTGIPYEDVPEGQHGGNHLKFIVKNNEPIPDDMIDLIEKSRQKLLGILSN